MKKKVDAPAGNAQTTDAPTIDASVVSLQKIKDYEGGLNAQREELLKQINMVDGALQLCRQLLDDAKEVSGGKERA